ncbi:MAG: gliding motility lipoprotein GldH [Muribaculaceae bacterium]|nr:gliding motility lipoprotein GldH [Muribaculaceae bacterium]
MKALRSLSMAVIAAIIASCSIDGHYGNGNDNFFSAFRTMPGAAWRYEEPVIFTVDTLRDSMAVEGDLLLTLRHTHGYEFRNLWLEIMPDLDNTLAKPDTLNIVFADVEGRWRGRGSGPSLQVSDTVAHGIYMRQGQKVRLRHIMRRDTVDGIEQIGITFIPR